jgi:ribosome maturation factor RimP
MNEAQQIRAIEEFASHILNNDPGFFLVDVIIRQGNNVKVYVDADQGVTIEKLVQLNRQLYKQIEGLGLFPGGNFSLEVSSPGLDEPLKLHRQYQKNMGRIVEVIKSDGIKVEGKLAGVSETEIVIEEEIKSKQGKKGKSTEPAVHVIPLSEIKTTKIQIKF